VKLFALACSTESVAGQVGKGGWAMLDKLRNIARALFGRQPGATALAGCGFRLRHGGWRAVYHLDAAEDAMVVEAVGHRREIYR
jgi:mRNA-degrading endonuclease RelE of RelBE toxin-antitoxin system